MQDMTKMVTEESILLDKLNNKIDDKYWEHLAKTCYLSNEVIDKYWNKLVKKDFLMYNVIPEDILDKHFEDLDYYMDKVLVVHYQTLSENFISRPSILYDDVLLELVCECQILSEEFIRKHFDEFTIEMLRKILDNQEISDELITDINDRLYKNDNCYYE